MKYGSGATQRARGAVALQPSAAAQQKKTAQLKLLQAVKVDQRLEKWRENVGNPMAKHGIYYGESMTHGEH